MSRYRLLQDSFDLVVNTMNLRPPQAEALRELKDALLRLPARLSDCDQAIARQFLSYKESWKHPFHPTFTVALATGVGKTRLAGAIIALLWLSNEARTFLILAPRRAVLQRIESALNPNFREYIFVTQNLIPEPHVIRSDEIDTPSATDWGRGIFSSGPQIFLLSPQLIASSERFKEKPEFGEQSPAELLRSRRDLVVLVDEAHHVGKISEAETTAWAQAIRDLTPRLQIGLTATPRQEPGTNLLYEYPLNKALLEGHYTKKVRLLVRKFGTNWNSEQDIDRATVDFALQRLAAKEEAVRLGVSKLDFPNTKPVAVIFCRDIEHASEISDWLIGSGRLPPDEVLVTHSKLSKSEEDVERLLNIERPDNPVRVVVNVMELTEGWDVTNVYVVAPLRAMATFTGALQAMGRGLRLPAGRRINDAELDTLDVLCFGKETLARIVQQATEWVGTGQSLSNLSDLKVTEHDSPGFKTVSITVSPTRRIVLRVRDVRLSPRELNLNINPAALKRVTAAIVEGLELAVARNRVLNLGGHMKFPRERFIAASVSRVIQMLPQHLADEIHTEPLKAVIEAWLNQIRPGIEHVEFDPMEVAEELSRVLMSDFERQTALYEDLGSFTDIKLDEYSHMIDVLDDGAKTKDFELPAYVMDGPFQSGMLYRGWQRAVHSAYAFDVAHEARVAWMLDNDARVEWWCRNQPRRIKIGTPAGNYHPDFLMSMRAGDAKRNIVLLEVKGDLFWEAPDGAARIKAAAGRNWSEMQSRFSEAKWDLAVALETDVASVESLVALEQKFINS